MLKLNLDRDWEYTESNLINPSSLLNPSISWKKIDLPHDAVISMERKEKNPSGADEGFTPGVSLFYRKKLFLDEKFKNKKLILEFEGIMGISEIFINGILISKHYYGYTSFLVDITNFIKIKEENIILIHVNTKEKPSSRWYAGAGIYRHVWLHVGERLYIKPWELHVSSKIKGDNKALLKIKVNIKNESEKDSTGKIFFQILNSEEKLIKEKHEDFNIKVDEEKIINSEIEVENFIKWDIENPYLYKLKAVISIEGKEVDESFTNFGIREINLNPQEGFKLNGRILKLKGGCIHHDNGILGSASYDKSEERKVEILKKNGFNAVRTAHNPFSPSFLDACDKLGMLVIEEFFDEWVGGKRTFGYHLYFDKYWEEEIENTIKRDFNHPSIIIWSIGNEITWGAGIDPEDEKSYSSIHRWTEKLTKKVKELDSTRFITQAFCHFIFEYENNIEMFEEMDIVYKKIKNEINLKEDKWGKITGKLCKYLDIAGYNYKHERYEYDHKVYPSRIICGTETFPYTSFDSWKETLKYPNVIGDFVWTAIDYLGEAGIGKVSLDEEDFKNFLGQYPWFTANCGDIDICGDKRPQSYYRDIVWGLRKDPIIFVLPPEYYGRKLYIKLWAWEPVERNYSFPGYEGKKIRIFVYANADEVELFLNGKSLCKKPSGEVVKLKTIYDINYEPGILEAIAYKDGKIIGKDTLETVGKPVKLKLIPEKDIISATNGDLCFIKIVALDEKEREVVYANNKIQVKVEGGEFLALGNADPCTLENFAIPEGKLYKGKALLIVKSRGIKEDIKITVEGERLLKDEKIIRVV
ncbi:MAG: glycoside hydrolase family 2 TIM barrel-domain containing protein [Dictyoglomaceae bacterium]